MSASEASEMDTLGTVPLWIKAELAENEVINHPDADSDNTDTGALDLIYFHINSKLLFHSLLSMLGSSGSM